MISLLLGILILFVIWYTYNQPNTNSLSTPDNQILVGGFAEEQQDSCQEAKPLVVENSCPNGAGLDFLTYLGLGPADQDQLNIINHKDHNNLAWILRRPVYPPRKLINNLKESNTGPSSGPYAAENLGHVDFKTWNPCNCDIGIVNLDRPPYELEGTTDAVALRLADPKTHNILYNLEPDFMRTSMKQYYGHLYYNDIRYPERPISVEFALNPAGYCLTHPQEYPCPLIASRKDIR
jgi:hypothetical protein